MVYLRCGWILIRGELTDRRSETTQCCRVGGDVAGAVHLTVPAKQMVSGGVG